MNDDKEPMASDCVTLSFEKLSLVEVIQNENLDVTDEKNVLLESIKSLHCPSTWFAADYLELTVDSNRLEEKSEEISTEERDWRSFILNLVLCYEYLKKDSVGDVLIKLRDLDGYIEKEETNPDKRDIHVSISALKHVSLASRCFFEFKSKLIGDVKKTLNEIQKIHLTKKDLGSIWGIKAAVFMEYGYNGNKTSVGFIEKAIDLDPDQSEWHFLLGKALGRIRRIEFFNDVPDKRYLETLERAVKMSENVTHMVFLAQAYREIAFITYSKNKNDENKYRKTCEKMNDSSVTLYRKALAIFKDSASVNIRCGLGFLKLPSPYRDVELAKTCILKGVTLAPTNAMAQHAAGTFYERNGEIDKAKIHLEQACKCKAFGAEFDMLRLKAAENQDFDPIPDFEKMRLVYTDKPRQQEIFIQMGSYWYFINEDFKTALNSWKIVLEQDPSCYKLKVHKCIFLRMQAPVNLHEVIFDEARLVLQTVSGTKEDRKTMRKLVLEYMDSHPHLAENPPVSHRKKVLQDIKENEEKKSRWKNRGRGRGRGYRGRGRGRGRGRDDGGQRDYHKGPGFQKYGRGRGGRGSRESSVENQSRDRGKLNFSRQRSRDSSIESIDRGRGKHYFNQQRNGESSTESRGRGRGKYEFNRQRSRDSSIESLGRGRDEHNFNQQRSRESSVESQHRTQYQGGGSRSNVGERSSHNESYKNNWRQVPKSGDEEERTSQNYWKHPRNTSAADSSSNWRVKRTDGDRLGEQEMPKCFQGYSRSRGKSGDSGNYYRNGSRGSSVDSQTERNHRNRDSSLSSCAEDNRNNGKRNWKEKPENCEGSNRPHQNRSRTDSVSSVDSLSSNVRDWKLGCSGGARGRDDGKQVDRRSQSKERTPTKEYSFSRDSGQHGSRESNSRQYANRGSMNKGQVKKSYQQRGSQESNTEGQYRRKF